MNSAPGGSNRGNAMLHAALLASAFIGLFSWTFGTWPDVMVDFGRELYVPWQMSLGRKLHTDIAWFNGPLSPHWNAWMFGVFGVGLSTLVFVNAALFATMLALLHFVLRRIASPGAATVACVGVIVLHGFVQLVGIGNYNFITPYSHEATHGVLLAVGALAAAQRWNGRAAVYWVLLCGLCIGLAFLTKPEMFVAALAGGATSSLAHAWSARFSLLRTSVALALGVLTPIVAAWLLQIGSLGSEGAWSSTLGAWPQLLASDVASLQFYRRGLGIDEPGLNLLRMFVAAAITLAFLAPGLVLARIGHHGPRRIAAAIASVVILAAAFVALRSTIAWQHTARAWPLFSALALVVSAIAVARHRGSVRWPGALGCAALALAMLAKMILNARLMHYGFALGLSATALLIAALWSWIPRRFANFFGDGLVWRTTIAAALAGVGAVHLSLAGSIYDRKQVEIGHGRDAFVTDVRGRIVGETLAWLERTYPPGSSSPTMAVFPEGVMINYLARLENSTPYINFMPPEMLLFGERNILDAYRSRAPDLVLLTHKSTAEYGLPWFGRDYGQSLMQWLMTNYRPVALFGDPPLGMTLPGEPPLQRAPVFGIRIFMRNR